MAEQNKSDSDPEDSEVYSGLNELFEVGLYIILSIQFMVFKFGITADDPKNRVENAATYFGRGDLIFFKFIPIMVRTVIFQVDLRIMPDCCQDY
jgi:hypothetical protein